MLMWILKQWKTITGIDKLDAQIAHLVSKVKAQNDLLYQVDKAKLRLAKDKIELQKKLDAQTAVSNVLNVRISELNSNIESLKTELAMQGVEVPTSKPSFLTKGYCYQPNIQVEGEYVKVVNPPDIYTRSDLLSRAIGINDLKSLSKYKKIAKVWEYVIGVIKYKYDKTDNWQLHPTTILRKFGDCEDGAIIFLDGCRMCGVSSAQVFNAVGNTSFGYHSYPIVWYSVEDLIDTPLEGQGEGWYIYETTIDFVPTAPKKLKGSKYWCEGGLQNWIYFGVVRSQDKEPFNGVMMPATGKGMSNKKRRIDNSLVKRNNIIRHWKGDSVEKKD